MGEHIKLGALDLISTSRAMLSQVYFCTYEVDIQYTHSIISILQFYEECK